MTDPHRGHCHAGVTLEHTFSRSGAADLYTYELSWFELLDWAVYHAPEWEQWQSFRQSLVGTPMKDRHLKILAWWRSDSANSREWPGKRNEKLYLANIVRVTNLLRSLRGQFSEHPVLREMLEHFNELLKEEWR